VTVEKSVESKKNVGKICIFLDIGCYIIIVIIQIVVDLFIYTWALKLLCRQQTVDVVFVYNYSLVMMILIMMRTCPVRRKKE
jgi:hypothetical protein